MRKWLVLILILVTTHAMAAVRKEVTEGETVTVKLSTTDPNVLSIKGDRIKRLAASKGVLKQNLDAKTGVLTLKPSFGHASEPFSAIVFTEKNKRYSLMIVPVKIPSQDIILQPGTFEVMGPIAFESKSPYSEMITSLIRAMVKGEAIESYQVRGTHDKFKSFSGGKLKMQTVYQGDKVRGEILTFKNTKKESVEFSEKHFYGPSVLAVALHKTHAAPNESVSVFRVVRNG